MKIADIQPGIDYAVGTAASGRFKSHPGGRWLQRATAVAIDESKRGRVSMRYVNNDYVESTAAGRVVCTWAEHEAAIAAQRESAEKAITRFREIADQVDEAVGPDMVERYGFYWKFEVYNDGTYSSGNVSMPRTAMAAIIEAAYERGKAAGAAGVS